MAQRRRCRRRAWTTGVRAVAVTGLLGLALLIPLGPADGADAAQATPTPAPLPDLAAMVLTPFDLPDPDYGIESGRRVSLDEEAQGVAAYRGQAATPEAEVGVRDGLQAAGWRERYVLSLTLPAVDDPELVAARVLSYVTAYDAPEGAAAGFALLEDESAIPTAADVPGNRTLGDESEVTSDSGTIAGLDLPYQSLDLTFRLGNLTAGVLIYDNLNRAPDLAKLEALADTLRGKIESVASGGGPGLGNRAVRIAGNIGIDFNDETYERRDGRTIPYAGESDEVRATRETNYGEAIDVYSVYQALVLRDGNTNNDPYVVTRLYRFPNEAAAATWLADLPERLAQEGAGYAEATPVADAPTFGDESLTLAYAFQASQTLTTRGTLVAVRVGNVVARVQVDAIPEPEPAGISALAELQTACLADGDCPPSVPAPDGILIPDPPSPDVAPLPPT